MSHRALIVEDEILVAMDLESALLDLGIEVVGIAPDRESALAMADGIDFALVDVNLRDGQTGPSVGRALAIDHGAKVIFVTANPAQLGNGVEGTIGVMTKPFSGESIFATVDFLTRFQAQDDLTPPRELHLFN